MRRLGVVGFGVWGISVRRLVVKKVVARVVPVKGFMIRPFAQPKGGAFLFVAGSVFLGLAGTVFISSAFVQPAMAQALARAVSSSDQERGQDQPKQRAEEHIVVKQERPALSYQTETGGKLGLSLQHNPATISVISDREMARKGTQISSEALQLAPGVQSSNASPGDPCQVVVRGFSETQVMIQRDGIYMGPTSMTCRLQNTFHFQSIELLQGPASVFQGQGAVGGIVDMRYKLPVLNQFHANALTSYGSFNTANLGGDVNIPLAETLAMRVDYSHMTSDYFVSGANPRNDDLTVSLLWKPVEEFTARLTVDYATDQLPTYFGTPLVPSARVSDTVGGMLSSSQGLGVSRSSLYRYYNVGNAQATSQNVLPTLHLDWQMTPDISLHSRTYFVYSKRRWQNAEVYSFVDGPGGTDSYGNAVPEGDIGRDRFYVYQNQHQVGQEFHAKIESDLDAGLQNTLVVGAQADYFRFLRQRGFPTTGDYADSVSLADPQNGLWENLPGLYPSFKSPTTYLNTAMFLEDVVTIQKKLRLIGGFRYDWMHLDRQNFNRDGRFNEATSFKGNYFPANFRLGAVYDVMPYVSTYASFSTGEDPPGSNLFLANKGDFEGLSHSYQEEIGIKADPWRGVFVTSLSFYNIDRTKILTTIDRNTVTTGGSQLSRGVEWQGVLHPLQDFTLDANVAYVYTRYGRNFHVGEIDASGNKVPNVAPVVANLWGIVSHVGEMPLDLGVGLRYVAARRGDYANTLRMNGYALVNLFAAWHAHEYLTVYGRINNVGNKRYVRWADVSYPSEVFLGEPRSFTISAQASF
ncbi:TonB-dependent receptor [Entomobacter blattae]|uniref:Vitamin B12 transporter BtuB n=1 Tax=Entomobacter blattae TaxID=2762277 RepID=A0A7H1NRI3_9PROT|nr:TonB-dependent receptor [Entomobacter blattae]QNT78393.1 Vitamin B12 transporter BtuB [Entomobacter blattae]